MPEPKPIPKIVIIEPLEFPFPELDSDTDSVDTLIDDVTEVTQLAVSPPTRTN